MSVQIKGLTKIYGAQKAVNNLTFNANKGEILGFLGPNGAGKSTTMKIITGFTPPTSGEVKVCDYDVNLTSLEIRRLIGYLPEHNPLYLDMYIHEYLQFVGTLHGMSGREVRLQSKKMIDLVGLGIEQNKKIGALSKGFRQRVGLAQALIHDPEVLILDEPTTGLDPNQLVEVRNVIKNISEDKTVILSTHIMQEVQALCDRVVIINRGNLVANDLVTNLIASEKTSLLIEFSGAIDHELINSIEGVQSIEVIDEGNYRIVHEKNNEIRTQLFELVKENNWQLMGMKQEETSLESIFQHITNTND
jgi:ABC-2 type transport system ATP-binding protein